MGLNNLTPETEQKVYFTVVVGNTAQGDTPEEVDFIDAADDQTAVQAAVDFLGAQGGSILIRKGIYNFTAPVTLDKSNVRIFGEGMGSTSIGSPTDGTDLFSIGSATVRSNIEIAKMTFEDRRTSPGNICIDVTSVENFSVMDCEFFSPGSNRWEAIQFLNTTAGDLFANIKIMNNVFDRGGVSDYLRIAGGGTAKVLGVIISDNNFLEQQSGNVIFLIHSNNVNIENNTFQDCTANVALQEVTTFTVANNTFQDCNGTDTISISSSTNGNVVGNATEGTNQTSLAIGQSSMIQVTGNSFESSTGGDAIIVLFSNATEINIVANSIGKSGGFADEGITDSAAGARHFYRSNQFYNLAIGVELTNALADNIVIQGNTFTRVTTAIEIGPVDIEPILITENFINDVATPIADNGLGNNTLVKDNSWQMPTQQTGDATPTNIFNHPIRDEHIEVLTAEVSGQQIGGGERCVFIRTVAVFRAGAGVATILGSGVQEDFTAKSDVLLDCTWDVSGNDARLRVTGLAATMMHWTALIKQREA